MKRIPQIQIAYVLPTEEPPQNNKIIVCVCARHRAKHLTHNFSKFTLFYSHFTER